MAASQEMHTADFSKSRQAFLEIFVCVCVRLDASLCASLRFFFLARAPPKRIFKNPCYKKSAQFCFAHGAAPVRSRKENIMHDQQVHERFIALRSSGSTYAKIMAELNVSKPTLIAWSRKHQFEIQNLRAIELEALREKWLADTTARVNALGEQLQKIEGELNTRDVADLSTSQLYKLAQALRRQIERETGPVHFTRRLPRFRTMNITSRSRIGKVDARSVHQGWNRRLACRFLRHAGIPHGVALSLWLKLNWAKKR